MPKRGSNRFIEDGPNAVVILDRSEETGAVLLLPLSEEDLANSIMAEIDERRGDSIPPEEMLGDDVDLASARERVKDAMARGLSREVAERIYGVKPVR